MGKWDDNLNAFWVGGCGLEGIAWKGSHQIFIYPCDDYPSPPSEIIQYHKRIETVDDFNDAIENGVKMKAAYTR